jgi:hypothetical protein
MVRVMDYNDIYWMQDPSHPSDIIPAALACGERVKGNGKDLIVGIVLGHEFEQRLCEAAFPGIRERGWHHATLTAFAAPIVAGRMLGFIPTLISATVIIILGMIMGEFVRALIVASAGAVEGVITVAKIIKGVMVMIAVFMALQQVGVSEELVTSAFTLILGSIALAAGLAFGLGNRDLAGEITRKWYEEGTRRNRRKTDLPEVPRGAEDGPGASAGKAEAAEKAGDSR